MQDALKKPSQMRQNASNQTPIPHEMKPHQPWLGQ